MADSQRKTANLYSGSDISGTLNNVPYKNDFVFENLSQGTYTFAFDLETTSSTTYASSVGVGTTGYSKDIQVQSGKTDGHFVFTFTIEVEDAGKNLYARFARFGSNVTINYSVSNIMLNTGSTALPYEPYWQHSLRKLTTSTDTITTLPSTIIADGNSATVGLQGNMTQTGTPTPENPITPQETGDRTENLFDYKTVYSSYIDNNGNIATTANNLTQWNYFTADEIGKTFTISLYVDSISASYIRVQGQINESYITGNAINAGSTGFTEITVTPTSTSDRWRITYGTGTPNVVLNQVMVAVSSTRKEYEPYGFKIPISSGGTTTPVYLGEVQSTRQIRKLVLTGEENITLYTVATGNLYRITLPALRILGQFDANGICSHYRPVAKAADRVNGTISGGNSAAVQGFVDIVDDYATVDEFKTYLQQQYAAGTPVTVWYVLAEPTTGIVNEPIRKIGDYVDTVSGITIPTITGKDSFDVLTTLKPSEVSLAYTGWHDATVKEKSRNLFDKDAASIGYYISSSTGEMIENSPSVASDYIPIIQGEEYYWNDPTARGNAGAFYDSNKNYLSGWSTSSLRYVFTAPNGAAYVRLTAAASNINNLQLNTGSTALPYEPYWK